MYKIGEISKLCNLPVKTLRYYDSVGLLAPDYVDRFTGYRYYSANKLSDCNRIIALKELGFSLDEIRKHLSATSTEDIGGLMDSKQKELKDALEKTELQLRRLYEIRKMITDGGGKVFDVLIKKGDTIRVAYVRKIFNAKEEAYEEAERIKQSLPKQAIGRRILIINYETEYKEKSFDLAACVEIIGKLPESCEFEERNIQLPGDMATLVCSEKEIDDAYRAITKYLETRSTQIIGAFYEFIYDDGAAEIKVPVWQPTGGDELCDDDINVPFENDQAVIGKWNMLDIVPSEEQFLYGHEKCNHQGWLNEIYFLEGGKPYWAVGGWTKGYLFTRGNYLLRNRYTIKNVDGHTLLFLEMRDFLDGGGVQRSAAPEIWIYEKVSSTAYKEDDIKRQDFVDYPFVYDENIVGKWRVKDFCVWEIDEFDFSKQNWSPDDLFLLELDFQPDGTCVHTTKDAVSCLKWTRGYMLNLYDKFASAYTIKIIDGKEYLIIEWKTGDYQFSKDARVYWYIMERE